MSDIPANIDALFDTHFPPSDTPVLTVTPSQPTQAQQRLIRWRDDPSGFVREVFACEPDVWQVEALIAIRDKNKISIKSGHGVGKSAFLAWLVIWWLSTRYPSKIACTAPSAHQLFDVLWSEIGTWLRKAIPEIREQFIVKSDKIELVGGGSETFAVARTSRKESPDALQGFHSPNMLFLVDECSGVDDVIFQVASGAGSTEGSKMVLTGNPTRTSGYFAKSHEVDSLFHRMTVSCLDARMVSRSWIEEMKTDWGEDSAVYKVRVLGEFPDSDSDALIPLDLVLDAVNRDIVQATTQTVWGVDVARYGADRSCLVKRYPHAVLDMPQVWSGLSTMELTGRIVNEWNIRIFDCLY